MSEKKLQEMEAVAATIRELAAPGAKAKALIEAVEEKHSEASKKEIARATFLSVILSAEYDPEDTQVLHDLAMETETTRRPESMTSSIGLSSSPFDHAHIRAAEVNWDDIRFGADLEPTNDW